MRRHGRPKAEPKAAWGGSKDQSCPRTVVLVEDSQNVTQPSEHDIILGRGVLYAHKSGNARYYELLDKYRPLYETAPTKGAKTKIVRTVLRILQERGARFLKKAGRKYQVVEPIEAKKKISHAIRYRNRNPPDEDEDDEDDDDDYQQHGTGSTESAASRNTTVHSRRTSSASWPQEYISARTTTAQRMPPAVPAMDSFTERQDSGMDPLLYFANNFSPASWTTANNSMAQPPSGIQQRGYSSMPASPQVTSSFAVAPNSLAPTFAPEPMALPPLPSHEEPNEGHLSPMQFQLGDPAGTLWTNLASQPLGFRPAMPRQDIGTALPQFPPNNVNINHDTQAPSPWMDNNDELTPLPVDSAPIPLPEDILPRREARPNSPSESSSLFATDELEMVLGIVDDDPRPPGWGAQEH